MCFVSSAHVQTEVCKISSNSMRFFSITALLLTTMLFLIGCGSSSPGGSSNNSAANVNDGSMPSEVKIGAVLYKTGPGAAYGEAQEAGLTIALDEINESGLAGVNIKLVVEDDEGKSEKSIAAVQKLINSEKVLAILGPTLSTGMFAAGPVANDGGVPIMGISNTADGITDIGEYVFRNSLPEDGVIPTTVAVAKSKLGVQKVAVMYGNDDDYTVAGYNVFKDALAKENIEVVSTQTFTKGQTNFSALLSNIRSADIDAIVVSGLYTEAGNLVKQARQAGIDVPIIGGNGVNSPEYIKIAGESANNTIVGSPWFTGRDDPRAQAFVQKFKEKYGKDPDQFAAQAYDGLYLFAAALASNPPATMTDRSAFRDALAEIKDFEGVTGQFTFDENRNPVQTPTILLIKDGEFTEFK